MARLARLVIPDVPHHVTQRGNRDRLASLVALLLIAALTSCTKQFYVTASVSAAKVTIGFYSDQALRHKVSPCIWLVDIVDDATGKSVLRFSADNRCVTSSEFDTGIPRRGLVLESENPGLKTGRIYHAEVSADEGVGRSPSWVQ